MSFVSNQSIFFICFCVHAQRELFWCFIMTTPATMLPLRTIIFHLVGHHVLMFLSIMSGIHTRSTHTFITVTSQNSFHQYSLLFPSQRKVPAKLAPYCQNMQVITWWCTQPWFHGMNLTDCVKEHRHFFLHFIANWSWMNSWPWLNCHQVSQCWRLCILAWPLVLLHR